MAEEKIYPLTELLSGVGDDAPVPTSYANHARIVAAGEEIFIDFLLISPKYQNEDPMARVVQRIIMPAERAAGMLNAFQVTAEAIKTKKQPKTGGE